MIKKTIVLAAMLMSMVSAFADNAAWYKYPVFRDRIDEVIATSNKIYYLSEGNLFSFNSGDNESYYYSFVNKLSDNSIRQIYYNAEKDYVLVVYENSNMDLIHNDGRVINLPDIKDSDLTDKVINNVSFGNDRIVVATSFGIVIYSDTRYEVIESGIYHCDVKFSAVVGDYLLIYSPTYTDDESLKVKFPNFGILYAPITGLHNNLDKFKLLFTTAIDFIQEVGPNTLVYRDAGDKSIYHRNIDFATGKITPTEYDKKYKATNTIKSSKDHLYTCTSTQLIILGEDEIVTKNLPDALRGKPLAFYSDPNDVWTGDPKGLSHYDISESTPTVLHNGILPPAFTTADNVGYMSWSPDGSRLYISNQEISQYKSWAIGENNTKYQTTNIVTDNGIIDVSLMNASAVHTRSTGPQKTNKNTRMYAGMAMVVEDPDDPDKYYCANYWEGLYVIKKNAATGEYEEIGKFNEDNAPIDDNWGERVEWVSIDKDKNLWIAFRFGKAIAMLPSDKRKQDPSTITIDDWVIYPEFSSANYGGMDGMIVSCKKSDFILFSFYNPYGFGVIDTRGTWSDISDDRIAYVNKLYDQDNVEVIYSHITFIVEDTNGSIWFGTDKGVFEIQDISKVFDPNFRIRRIKVPRNDGTNYADYLLESDKIYWIAVDPSNRKWIATEASGLFLVSEKGDQILANYTSSNSPLASNCVACVEPSPVDNTVYVGTPNGLYSFKSDSSPGRADYSNVYAYPNPVRPEYSGMVTITGLVSNTVLKITDSMGNVVFETRSEGGMATWDACNMAGDRVPSGVYYVYASENVADNSRGAVTKILVIK